MTTNELLTSRPMNRIDIDYFDRKAQDRMWARLRPWWLLRLKTRGHDVGGVDGRGFMWAFKDSLYVIAYEGEHDNVVNGAPPIPGRFPITLQPGASLTIQVRLNPKEADR